MTRAPSPLADLLAECDAHGIRLLLANDGALTIDAPQDALTPDLLGRLKAHKSELLTLLVRASDFDIDSAPNAEPAPITEKQTHRMPPELRGRVEATVDTCPMVTHWPIVEGTEHFCIWVDDDAPWPEFIPGYHHDFRQPSRLTPLCAARKEFHAIDRR